MRWYQAKSENHHQVDGQNQFILFVWGVLPWCNGSFRRFKAMPFIRHFKLWYPRNPDRWKRKRDSQICMRCKSVCVAADCKYTVEANGLVTIPAYSFNLCQIECRMNLALKMYNCIPHFYRNICKCWKKYKSMVKMHEKPIFIWLKL